MQTHAVRATFLTLLLAGAACCLHGQVVGSGLSGTVHDETGAPIPNAAVTIRNLETG
ncbi:MAG: carboxypeptidase regulatory-like domain-containing protein, partial [Acidobacteriaceae bacterium]|nr:carboxypeptidase regulatory-like domain-containing protein [Acidobacteriaceae bacterium]